jgi:hypothetical protein
MNLFTRGREGNFRLTLGRNEMNALIGLFRSIAVHSALPKLFLAAGFSGAALSVASVRIEDECVSVFEGVSTGLPDSGRWSKKSKPGLRMQHHRLRHPREMGGVEVAECPAGAPMRVAVSGGHLVASLLLVTTGSAFGDAAGKPKHARKFARFADCEFLDARYADGDSIRVLVDGQGRV